MKRTVLTLADIESGLPDPTRAERTTISVADLEASLPSPPGLGPEPPLPARAADEPDPYLQLMSEHEQDLVARIHLRQLTTPHPDREDFYYQSYARRQQGSSVEEGGILYLPMPPSMLAFKSLARDRKTTSELANALGRASRGSAQRPKTQLQVVTSPVRSPVARAGSEIEALAAVERVYKALALAETAEGREEDAALARAEVREAILSSDDAFLRFVNRPKGRRATPRILRLLGHEQAVPFVERLLRGFEYLAVLKEEDAVDSFISTVMGPVVGLVNGLEAGCVRRFLGLLLDKPTLPWIAIHRLGQVLLCILCSRLAILSAATAGESPGEDETGSLHERLFLALQSHLADMATNRYGWQLLALVAAQVGADQKRTMVLQVRERILAAVDADDTGPVNVFLHALGLDAAQLKPSQ